MRVLVTGGNGLCGSALRRRCVETDHDFVFSTRQDCDLLCKESVDGLIAQGFDSVIHASAKVGGIGANEAMHADFFYQNMQMNLNVMKACLDHDVQELMVFSSVCVFPNDLALLEEDRMHNGPVYGSNFAYGYAKRMVDVYLRAVKQQYGDRNWCSIIPGNIFGPNDMFSVEHGHIIPSLMHKLYLAKEYSVPFTVWGDGLSCREFIYVDDLADAILSLLGKPKPDRLIVSGDEEISIRWVVDALVEIAEFNGPVVWDTTKPNGQRNRPTSKKEFNKYCPDFERTEIYGALQHTWRWFVDNYQQARVRYDT